LTAQETAILRNSRFAVGDTYFELEQYPQALRAYQSAANHYATSPEVLDAYLQIANIYRRLDRRPKPARRWSRPPGIAADSTRSPFRTDHKL